MKALLYILCFISLNALSQNDVVFIFEELPTDSLPLRSISFHSTLKPSIRLNTDLQTSKLSPHQNPKKNVFSIAPLADLNGSYLDSSAYRFGAGVNMQFSSEKWCARASAIAGIGSNDNIFQTMAFYKEPKNVGYVYTDVRGRVSFTPNEIFNFQAGLDNQFIGEGNRSLFLSDYGTPSPFAQIRTRFWRLEYTVMYQFFREKFGSKYRSKYGATHHISLNAAKWLNIGVFESVIFRPKDTLLNRGYDAEYLNPVIFYRPQEYSLGSSDNVLLGLSVNGHWKKNTIYSQLILDEFSLTELRAKTGWWANKFGVQLGFKSYFKKDNAYWFYRLEYNFVRPYTYAHIDDMHNYANQSSSLAHPLGSNFHELIGELKWQKDRYLVKLFTTYRLQGTDRDSLNFGDNIYQPYINRLSDYGNYIGQGKGVNTFHTVLTLDYELYTPSNLHVFFENHLRYSTLSNTLQYYPLVGVRSQLWNDYRNY